MIGREPLMQRHGHVVHLTAEVNVEYKKDIVRMMTTVSCTLNVEQEIAKIKTPCLNFQLVLTAAMTLFQVREKKIIGTV